MQKSNTKRAISACILLGGIARNLSQRAGRDLCTKLHCISSETRISTTPLSIRRILQHNGRVLGEATVPPSPDVADEFSFFLGCNRSTRYVFVVTERQHPSGLEFKVAESKRQQYRSHKSIDAEYFPRCQQAIECRLYSARERKWIEGRNRQLESMVAINNFKQVFGNAQ